MRMDLRFRAVTTASLLALLGGSAQAGDVKVLRPEVPPTEKAYYETVVKAFEQAHPGVNISFEYLANEAYKQKLTTLLQSNQKPDIIFSWSGGVLQQQAKAGVLSDITSSVSGAWASSLSPISISAFTIDGKIYGVPMGASDVVFWANRDLAAKAGIDLNAIKSWSDLLEAVKKAKVAGVTPIVVGGKDKWPLHFYYGYLMLREAGKDGFAAAIAGKGDGFAAAPFVKAGEDFKALLALEPFQTGFMDTTFEQATGLFGDGKGVFHFMGDWDYGTQKQNSASGKGIPDDKLTTIRFPVVTGGAGLPTDTFGGITGWAVTKGASPDAPVFLQFLTTLDNQKLAGAKGLFIPVVKGADAGITNPFFQKMAASLEASTYHQLFLDQALGSDVGATVNDVAADLAQGATTPQEAAKTVQGAWADR